MVLAGAFAQWYWTFRKEEAPCCAITPSLFNAVVFHLGTLAFGSCIIAVIRMIRTVLSYIEKKLKRYTAYLDVQGDSGGRTAGLGRLRFEMLHHPDWIGGNWPTAVAAHLLRGNFLQCSFMSTQPSCQATRITL